jgi:hypothetical protein
MPSELCYKSVVTNAERKLKIAVPEAQRTTCHYCAFLDAVSCFDHHSQDMSSLFLKMFAAFTGCRDIEINNHIRAMRQMICSDPNALNIRVAIATLKNLLTNMDEDQVENTMVLASTAPSNKAEQSNIMAMPAIAQMQNADQHDCKQHPASPTAKCSLHTWPLPTISPTQHLYKTTADQSRFLLHPSRFWSGDPVQNLD